MTVDHSLTVNPAQPSCPKPHNHIITIHTQTQSSNPIIKPPPIVTSYPASLNQPTNQRESQAKTKQKEITHSTAPQTPW